MKAALVMNHEYIRKLNLSALIVAEFGDRIAGGDILCDVVTKKEFVVDARGFTPRRSDATASRLAWSRESSLSVKGDCGNSVGRVWSSPESADGWRLMSSTIVEKDGAYPVDVPVVGECRVGASAFSAIAVCSADGLVRVVASLASLNDLVGPIEFKHNSTAGRFTARMSVDSVDPLGSTGAFVTWSDEDVAVRLV